MGKIGSEDMLRKVGQRTAVTVSRRASFWQLRDAGMLLTVTNLVHRFVFESTVCQWDGIKCAEGEIYEINLGNTQLVASIPEALGTVTSIKNLYFGESRLGTMTLLQLADFLKAGDLFFTVSCCPSQFYT
jgi:hypothetical protein